MSEPIIASLIALTEDKPIVIYPAFVRFTGSLETGMMLCQLLYWTPRARLPGGWIAKSDAEWSKELCITAYASRKARQQLAEMEIVELKKDQFRGAPTMHYRINQVKLTTAWLEWIEQIDCAKTKNRLCENEESIVRKRQIDCAKTTNRLCENEESITEITTENTPEITTKTPDSDIDAETAAWIADLENQQTPPANPPSSAEEYRERLRETEGKMLARLSTEPYLTWGMQSQQAQDDLAGMLEAEKVQWLGYELEQAHNLIPLWTDRKAVTSWLTGLQKCVAASRGTPRLAMQAAKRLRDKEMTVASPWSLVKTTQAIWAENQSARGGNGDGWSKDELTQAAEEAARELGE